MSIILSTFSLNPGSIVLMTAKEKGTGKVGSIFSRRRSLSPPRRQWTRPGNLLILRMKTMTESVVLAGGGGVNTAGSSGYAWAPNRGFQLVGGKDRYHSGYHQ